MIRSYGLVLLTLLAPFSVAAGEDADALVVALLQMRPEGNDLEANAAKAVQFCRDAAAEGADIALMPEMWSIGYTRFKPDVPGDKERFYEKARAKDSPYIQQFSELAKELNMAIGVGYLQSWAPLPRNALTLFDRFGKEAFTYAKVHTSDFKSMEASMTPGDGFHVAEVDTAKGPVRIGAMICFDREQPESARILMLKGAEIVLTPNACGLDDLRLQQFRIRAWENAMGVAMTNYPIPDQNGRSVAYGANGDELALARGAEGIYLARFDLEDIRARQRKVIWGNAYRRPHRYGLLTSPEKAPVWNRIDGLGNPYDNSKR